MPFITNTGLRDLKHSEFGTIGDPLVVKDIPGINQDGPGKGFNQQISSRADDAVRMSRLLVLNQGRRTEAGNKFLANLALINQQATLAKVQKKDFEGLGRTALKGAADTGKIIASTLAQVPVAGTGVHFVNGGKIGKEYLEGGGNAVGSFLRDLGLGGGGIQGHERVLSGNTIFNDIVPGDENYPAGENVDLIPTSLKNRYFLTNPDSFVQQKDTTFIDTLSVESKDAVKTRLRFQGDPNYEKRKHLTSIDQINASDIRQTDFFRDADIIPFEFQIFDPSNGGQADYLYFRAYLSTLGDTYTGNWNATKYVGRAENLYNYDGFDRSITFSFKIAAHTREELRPLYRKLNYLVGTTAPSYDENLTFMRGVYAKVTIGDYLVAIPGFFENISIDWSTLYPWEIGVNLAEQPSTVPRVPHVLDINMTYKPVHNFNPALGESFIATEDLTYVFTPSGLERQEVKPESAGVRELDLSTAYVNQVFPEAPFKKSTGVPKLSVTNLNDVPQRKLIKVPETQVPPKPSLGSNTVIPYKVPLLSKPFGG